MLNSKIIYIINSSLITLHLIDEAIFDKNIIKFEMKSTSLISFDGRRSKNCLLLYTIFRIIFNAEYTN